MPQIRQLRQFKLYSVYEFVKSPIASFEPGNVGELARTILHLHRNWPRLAELVRGMDYFNAHYSWAGQSAGYVDLVDRLNRQ